MRNAWIAVALIVLLVGAAVAYGIGRAGKPARASAPPAKAATQPVIPATPEVAPVAPQPRRDEEAPTTSPASTRSQAEAVRPTIPAIPTIATAAGTTARSDGQPLPRVPAPGDSVTTKTSPPRSPLNAPPSSPTNSQQSAPQDSPPANSPVPTEDPESDRSPPVLQNLRFDPPEIQDGGTVILSIGATDELSGVKSVYGALRSSSGAATVPFGARDGGGSGVFSATIVIPAHAETGDWIVGNLQIVDKAENNLVLSFARATVPAGGVLRVVSSESDSTAPEVRGVSVVKGSVDAGGSNQIVVEVEDDRSGVAQVTGAFQSPSKAAYIPFTCVHSGESPTWEGVVTVPESADCGEWTLKQLRVVDKANNSAFLSMDSPQVGRVSFLVTGGNCDSEPPVIDALYFSPARVSNTTTSEITLNARAHDDGSGVASLSGWIDGPVATNGQAPRIFFECRPDPRDKDGPMTARVTVPYLAGKGVWRVSLAQLMDKARNTRPYNRDDPALRDAAFTVE
jgi:hypothetical protein